MDHHGATLSTTKFLVTSAKPWTLQIHSKGQPWQHTNFICIIQRTLDSSHIECRAQTNSISHHVKGCHKGSTLTENSQKTNIPIKGVLTNWPLQSS